MVPIKNIGKYFDIPIIKQELCCKKYIYVQYEMHLLAHLYILHTDRVHCIGGNI
jgi:hypothetical protein